MTAVAFILLAVAMIVGPIMMMRPSPSQARLAKLRSAAEKKGLHIRLDKNPYANNKSTLAVYSFPVKLQASLASGCSLFRKPYVHEIHFCRDWDWYKKGELNQAQMSALQQLVGSLDKSIEGLECNPRSLGFYWSERMTGLTDEQALDTLFNTLNSLKEGLQT